MPICNSSLRVVVFYLLLFFPVLVFANDEVLEPGTDQVLAYENPSLFSLIDAGRIDGVRLGYKDDFSTFYQGRHGAFLWVRDGRFTSDARDVFGLIQDSWQHGLNPDNYHRMELASLMGERFADGLASAKAELLMGDAAVRYGRDISGMRLSAKTLEADPSSWSRGVMVSSLLDIMAQSRDPERVLEMLAPQDRVYKALQQELKRVLKEYDEHAKSGVTKFSLVGLLRPGERNPAVVSLRDKMGQKSPRQDADLYDGDLQKSVMAFQKARGLMPDGVIGPRTVIAINEGPRERLIKVLANLERRRWVKRPMPSRYVEVNIPAMWLKAVEGNDVAFDMPIVVGRKKRPTMSFVDDIVGIRFNPSWYVPDTIKKEDYLPELQKDPQALAEKGIAFRVRAEDGSGLQTVAPEDIDWANMTAADLKSVQMVQGPGAANALGQIRVLMPNRYDIYLHDTNMPSLFKKDDRAQSSGCMRMSEPQRMANFILGHNQGWSNDRLEYYLQKAKTLEIKAELPTPVYIFYYTIWEGTDGKLIFGNDIYGLDKDLVNVLKSNGKVNFPMI
ncbi:MAG TPA: L,D-transpeptidase family protein [Alphaproteobacteria bacterium]|nr:L,D-transpeptidase family protein [Alphaproteobacteria bacterium]